MEDTNERPRELTIEYAFLKKLVFWEDAPLSIDPVFVRFEHAEQPAAVLCKLANEGDLLEGRWLWLGWHLRVVGANPRRAAALVRDLGRRAANPPRRIHAGGERLLQQTEVERSIFKLVETRQSPPAHRCLQRVGRQFGSVSLH